ncbi:MAG: GYD domain-containing protein [Pseudomonadota bacterium]|jgi:uncharacterized protein with GYD domain|nr:MAG: GYD family protein [Pseudomonadota bacterium]HEX5599256.1 GYD domain-containing protein [Hyphomicrobiaceae bacterium]
MATFIMLTRLSHEATQSPASIKELSHKVMEHIRKDCPEVEWKKSFAVLGPADYLDIFTAPDTESAMKVATVIRTFGHATTEVWPATEWDRFVDIISPMGGSSGA